MHAYIYRLRVRLAYAIQTNPWVWLLCLGYSWEPESYDCLFTEE